MDLVSMAVLTAHAPREGAIMRTVGSPLDGRVALVTGPAGLAVIDSTYTGLAGWLRGRMFHAYIGFVCAQRGIGGGVRLRLPTLPRSNSERPCQPASRVRPPWRPASISACSCALADVAANTAVGMNVRDLRALD
jgi:hypothetical protein